VLLKNSAANVTGSLTRPEKKNILNEFFLILRHKHAQQQTEKCGAKLIRKFC
jgi:hypothetical protein